MQNNLSRLAKVFRQVTDPRSKHGTYPPCAGMLALVFLGLLAGQNYLTHTFDNGQSTTLRLPPETHVPLFRREILCALRVLCGWQGGMPPCY